MDYRNWFDDGRLVDEEKTKQIDEAIGYINSYSKRIKIIIRGGIIQDLTDLPPGYDYEVDDIDPKKHQ